MTPSATLFAQPVPVDRRTHRLTRVRDLDDRRAAAGVNAVFCAAAEFGEACKVFPLLFVRGGGEAAGDPAAALTPVCLLGLAPDENLFVDGGRWTGAYEPAFLRRYPFALAEAPGGGAPAPAGQALVMDAAFAGLADDGPGERLFGDDGTPTPFLDRTVAFLNDVEAAAQITRPIGAHLQSLGLLKDMRAEGRLDDGEPFKVDGFQVVDEARLRNLPDDVVLQLHRGGLLALVHAHLVSLGNLSTLVARKSARRRAG